jgi:hypothetical protein
MRAERLERSSAILACPTGFDKQKQSSSKKSASPFFMHHAEQ